MEFYHYPSKDKVCVNAKVISAEKSANYLAKLEIFDKAGKCKAQSETLEFSTNNNNAEINFNLKIKRPSCGLLKILTYIHQE